MCLNSSYNETARHLNKMIHGVFIYSCLLDVRNLRNVKTDVLFINNIASTFLIKENSWQISFYSKSKNLLYGKKRRRKESQTDICHFLLKRIWFQIAYHIQNGFDIKICYYVRCSLLLF